MKQKQVKLVFKIAAAWKVQRQRCRSELQSWCWQSPLPRHPRMGGWGWPPLPGVRLAPCQGCASRQHFTPLQCGHVVNRLLPVSENHSGDLVLVELRPHQDGGGQRTM